MSVICAPSAVNGRNDLRFPFVRNDEIKNFTGHEIFYFP